MITKNERCFSWRNLNQLEIQVVLLVEFKRHSSQYTETQL